MARPGLYKSDVKIAYDALLAQGRHPSVDAVRVALGNTGSKSTIHKYIKELDADAGKPSAARANTTSALQHLVDELAGHLHADADARIAAMRAEHMSTLRGQAEEIARLQQEVARLQARLQVADAVADRAAAGRQFDWDDMPSRNPQRHGFGVLQNLVQNDRAGIDAFPGVDSYFNNRSGSASTHSQVPAAPIFWKV